MRVVIEGIAPYDGEYEIDQERALNAREWRWIKRISGYMPFTLDEGLVGGDPDLFIAIAVVAMCRDGKVRRDDWERAAERMSEAHNGAIDLIPDKAEQEDDALPPDLTGQPDGPSPNGSPSSESSPSPSSTRSGSPSTSGSGPAEIPLPTTA